MSEYNYNYRDNSFNTQMAYAYTLLLQVGFQGFDYAVLYENRVIVCERNCELQRLQAAQSDEVFSAPFRRVIIGLANNGFTLIPDAVFNPAMAANLGRFLDAGPQDRIMIQQLDSENQVVYKTSDAVLTALSKYFKLSDSVFASKGFITASANNNPSSQEVYLNFKKAEEKLEILYFKSWKLNFYNSFVVKNPDEAGYFMGIVCAELKLEPATLKLIISGDTAADDAYFIRLSEFFRTELSTLVPVEIPEVLLPHQLLPLTSLILCA